jgi:hypothetical protein
METGFLKRAKAEPLLENPALLNAETLNEIYGPVETENIFVIRSMWTASCIFRLDGILIDSEDIQMRAWERVADTVGGRMPSERQVFKAMHVSPEEAVRTIFEWTGDEIEARGLADTFDQVCDYIDILYESTKDKPKVDRSGLCLSGLYCFHATSLRPEKS